MNKGFTLIELLIALSLSAILLGASFYFLSTTLKSVSKVQKEIERFRSSQIVLQRITREVRGAKSILSTSNQNRLVLNCSPDIITYDFKDDKVRRIKNLSGSYLTTENQIQRLSFSYPAANLVEIQIKAGRKIWISKALVRNHE